MYDLLLKDRLPTVSTPWLEEVKTFQWNVKEKTLPQLNLEFQQAAREYFLGTSINRLSGLDRFPVIHTILGCNHAIDSLIMRYGVDGLQIFRHDYAYYTRLNPGLTHAQPGQLVPSCPVLMAMPSPGYLGPHPQQQEILDEAAQKDCEVHLDCAWLGAARDIQFNFDHPAVASVSMSLSKGMDMWWNRVGIRWSRQEDDTNPVSIYNTHNMIHQVPLLIGLKHLRSVKPDHVWTHYHDRYHALCGELKLRPTRMIHVAQSLDRVHMYGMKLLLEKGWR
jgi:hypothetical protein